MATALFSFPEGALRPADPRALRVAVAVALALLWSTVSGDLLRALMAEPPLGSRYLRAAIIMASDLGLMLLLAGLAARKSPAQLLALSGLFAAPLRPFLWSLAVVLPPALVVLAVVGLAADIAPERLLWTGWVGPIYEELLYRGLAVGILMRVAGWGLVPAAILPALFFAAGHIWQGSDTATLAGVLAITGIGGVYFAWLFVAWGFHLWPPILIHAWLNSAWIVFALGETAVGGPAGNLLRAAVIALSIISTLLIVRRR
jgi:hypothetical protein